MDAITDAITEIPGLHSLLAGYDVFGRYADAASSKAQLFVKDALENFTFDGPDGQLTHKMPKWVTYAAYVRTLTWTVAETSAYAYESKMSSRTSVSGGTAAFKGEVEASFSEEQRSQSSQTYCAHEEQMIQWELSMPNEDLRVRLTAQARADIDSMSPTELFQKYGTHYVRYLYVGSKLGRYSSLETSKYSSSVDIAVAVAMSYKKATTKLSADEQAAYGKAVQSFDALAKTRSYSQGTDTRPEFVAFRETGALEPIWKLAETPARQQEIEEAFHAYVESVTCVMYGDEVYLMVVHASKYMCGARGDGNRDVYMASWEDKPECFRWKVWEE